MLNNLLNELQEDNKRIDEIIERLKELDKRLDEIEKRLFVIPVIDNSRKTSKGFFNL